MTTILVLVALFVCGPDAYHYAKGAPARWKALVTRPARPDTMGIYTPDGKLKYPPGWTVPAPKPEWWDKVPHQIEIPEGGWLVPLPPGDPIECPAPMDTLGGQT